VAEVVVVGSGIIGLSVAYELARRGARVTVLDARAAGLGATQASAGVLAPYIEAPSETPLRALGVDSLRHYDEFLARVARDARIDIEYQRTGSLEVALDAEEAEHLRSAAARLEAAGVKTELLEGAAAFRHEPLLAPSTEAVLFIPEHGFVSAPGLVRALVRAGDAHGVVQRSGSRVTRIVRDGDRLVTHTEGESFAADIVVMAAGSWSGQIEQIESGRTIGGGSDRQGQGGEASAVPVRPVRGQLLHLAWMGPSPLSRVTWGARCYMVPWADGTLLVGATVEEAGFAEDVTVAGIRTLLDAACELVPQTASAAFKEGRVGLRPGTPDTLPIIGPSADVPGLFYATGHYRNGILLAPLTAMLMADGILEGRWHALLDAVSPARFQARGVLRANA
jgi:glycine oxidase